MVSNTANTFDYIASNPSMQNKLLGKDSPLSEDSKSRLFNSLVNRETNAIGKPIAKFAYTTLIGEGIGFVGGKAFSWAVGKYGGRIGTKSSIQFGSNSNQVYHTFRHIDQLGLDRATVSKAVSSDLKSISSSIKTGQTVNRIISVEGKSLQYTAYKLQNGTLNVGRIHAK
jgi:hypothetical protein